MIVVGEATMLRSDDGGINWTVPVYPSSNLLYSVSFGDPNNGFAVGLQGRILKTADGGVNWIELPYISSYHYHGVSFSDQNHGTIVGYDGVILRTTTGGLSWTEGDKKGDRHIPQHLSLSQNYPNPFNPSTSLAFDLPRTSIVTLKIYNMLGEEVATLVSDRLSAGSYSYEWDASSLASGVYIYRLEAEGFVQTRKMILMK